MIKCFPPSATRSLAAPTPSPWPTTSTYNTRLTTRRPPAYRCIPNQRHSFHATPTLHAAEKSLYEILNVSPTVTKSELKKQFYKLSKETHPDINKANPHANDRFAEVSEAYAVLGNDQKRAQYDREVMPRYTRRDRGGRSSGSGGTYAGSRPATGLSKRRGTFRGPPPSFYTQAGQRGQVDEEEQARRDQASYDSASFAGRFDASAYAEAGRWDPTFNPTPVYKTQSAEDKRRDQRRAAEMAAAQTYAEEQGDFWVRFLLVSGVVGFGVGVGTMVNRMGSTGPRGGLVRGDGSKRNRETA